MIRATVRDRIDGDLNASLLAWTHFTAYGLASQLVCRVLFARWRICACGRCPGKGGDR